MFAGEIQGVLAEAWAPDRSSPTLVAYWRGSRLEAQPQGAHDGARRLQLRWYHHRLERTAPEVKTGAVLQSPVSGTWSVDQTVDLKQSCAELVGAHAGSRHRTSGHVAPGAADEQLGTGADEPAVGVHDATRLGRAQRGEHGARVERGVRLDHDLARQHHFLDRTRFDRRQHGRDFVVPLGGPRDRGDGEARRGIARSRGRRRGRERRLDGRSPHRTIGRALHDRRGHEQASVTSERQRADRPRPHAGGRVAGGVDRA
jgi:hypothetical protein